MACIFAAYDKHMKCIIWFRFVLESRGKMLKMESFMHRDEISKMYHM